MNLTTKRIWCYRCETEVFMDAPQPPQQCDSDQDGEECAPKSHDSGHGSYSTIRTQTPDRNNIFGFERTVVGLNVGT